MIGFFIYNKFKVALKNPSLDNLFSFDIINEKYFETESRRIQTENELEKLLSTARAIAPLNEKQAAQIKLYGPLFADKIESTDYIKLDFETYCEKIEHYISKWKEEGWNDLAVSLEYYHKLSIRNLQNENAPLREYYFLDEEELPPDKHFEVNWYDYFFSVISTLKNSPEVITMNFGYD